MLKLWIALIKEAGSTYAGIYGLLMTNGTASAIYYVAYMKHLPPS
jgi:hypothetical protein